MAELDTGLTYVSGEQGCIRSDIISIYAPSSGVPEHHPLRHLVLGEPRHAARNEYRMLLATMPLPAKPTDTKTGVARPGTATLSNRTL